MNLNSNESNYLKPQYLRQRSSSCGSNWCQVCKEENEPEIHLDIHLVRRRSLGNNMKLAIDTPVVANIEKENKNELIISIPVLISDNNCIKKDFDPESCDKHITYGEPKLQSSWSALRQMLIPFLIAGIGSVGAGIVLNKVQHWPAFDAIPQLIIMIPSFLGLIGNIETTLASRLSTHANLGTFDTYFELKSMIIGNSAVVQCQASTVGLFAAIASLVMSYISSSHKNSPTFNDILLLSASSVITSVLANTLLATTITSVILVARKININPDNIATPIAASMGDVCTITILALISDFLFKHSDGNHWLLGTALVALLMFAPIMGYIARKNRYTRSVILTGWIPILGAVILEQPGGIVMEKAFDKYDVMSTFQPLVNGIGSNLVGIQTSRLSTFLHQTAPKGKLPKSNPRPCIQPFAAFIGRDIHSRMARLLLAIAVPTHIFYLIIIRFWQKNFVFTAPFLISYMFAILIQVALLLYLAYGSVLWAWKRRINPDNSAIPFTSALADVFGNCLMAAVFTFLDAIGDVNAQVYETNDTTIASNLTANTINTFYL